MGNIFRRSKSEDTNAGIFSKSKLMCGRSKKKANDKNGNADLKSDNKNEKSPTSKDRNEWTEVQLQVPDSALQIERKILVNPPVRPPRKNRSKNNTLERDVEKLFTSSNVSFVDSSVNETRTSNDIKLAVNEYENRMPVEEPIIVPKKEPIHICDGTHHHVTNIVNGKVIHSNCSKTKNNILTEKSTSEKLTSAKPAPVRPKFTSTVSLPDIDQLTTKKNKTPRVKTTTRQISVISLPTESRVALSDVTAARLENYLRRCKNFNGLPPKQLLEQLQSNGHLSDSDDSLTDDWGILDILERHGLPKKSPLEPKCKLHTPSPIRNPYKIDNINLSFDTKKYLNNIEERRESLDDYLIEQKKKLSLNSDERRESIDDFSDEMSAFALSKYMKGKEERRESIDDFKEELSHDCSSDYSKFRDERRESIDEFFDAEPAHVHSTPIKEMVINTKLVQNNSNKDLSQGYSSKLKSDIYYTNALLDSESKHSAFMTVDKSEKNKIKEETKSELKFNDKVETQSSKDTENEIEEVPKAPPKTRSKSDKVTKSKRETEAESKSEEREHNKDEVKTHVKQDPINTETGDLLEVFQQFYEAHDKFNQDDQVNNTTHDDVDSLHVENKPKRKLGNVQHSNLLKILQENSNSLDTIDKPIDDSCQTENVTK